MSRSSLCRQSGIPFEIRDADLAFFEKISPVYAGRKVMIPPPTLSPSERERRRLAFRNERKLFRRKSDLNSKDIISFFPPHAPFKVYSHEEWWSDGWNAATFGRTFNTSQPFFMQFQNLQRMVPRVPLINNGAVNSDFCNFADNNKNCYLLTSANYNEDSYFGFCAVSNRNAVDTLWCTDCELVYECIDCRKCYDLKYSQNCDDCHSSAFLADCRGVSDSLLCIGIRQKRNHLLNQPTSPQMIAQLKEELRGSERKRREMEQKFAELQREHVIRMASVTIGSENCTGNNLFESRNIHHGFDVYSSHDCAYLHDGLKAADCFDVSFFDGTELCYESTSLMGYGYRFTMYCRDSHDLFYCDSCHGCEDCFGCVGLRKKKYCILNKQYTREEYEQLALQIVEHMSKTGEWGEFFPVELSPFAYNETIAQEYFPLTREGTKENGWLWREEKDEIPKVSKVIPAEKLPDSIDDIPDDILNWAIECKATKRPFKIIKQELDFYRKMRLPVPHHHPDERHRKRMALRNPRQLWNRPCMKCGKEMQTTYAPDRPETVYCEECYLKEVY
ncbi:MAG: hypothetical protein PHE68_02410 [Candidatus Peribacteraceae bacterium]|nr:hypothetical protein [Candidatus Peribacteraceae bacterium]MDD5074289.1 hypothetical protein [Candidatus Peribacteraceae bacterium]